MQGTQDENIRAFTEVFVGYAPTLRRLVRGILRSCPASVDDVLQDVWVKGSRAFQTQHKTVRTWLGRIAINAAIDELRRHARCRVTSNESAVEEMPDPRPGAAALHEHLENQLELRDAVQSLPAHQREAVLLVDFMGLRPMEAARALDLRPNTLCSRLHYGRKALGERLRAA